MRRIRVIVSAVVAIAVIGWLPDVAAALTSQALSARGGEANHTECSVTITLTAQGWGSSASPQYTGAKCVGWTATGGVKAVGMNRWCTAISQGASQPYYINRGSASCYSWEKIDRSRSWITVRSSYGYELTADNSVWK